MYKVSLVNLPFADIAVPSLALLQLKTVTEEACGDRVRVRVLDLNGDFARFLGLELYSVISGALDANMYGLGEWFFRPIAFPDVPDNEQQYFNRCFRSPKSLVVQCRQLISDKRRDVGRLMNELIDAYQLADEDIVGSTSMFCQSLASFGLARELKKRKGGLITVMGGANCESPMGQAIVTHVPAVDYTFSGPSLSTFPRFVQQMMAGDLEACEAMNGVFTPRNVASGRCDPAKNAAGSPSLAGEDVSIDRDMMLDYTPFLDKLEADFGPNRIRARLMFETSRGCWWGERAHCTFCGLNKLSMGYRSMSPERAIRHFEHLFTYADRCAQFDCVDNIMPKEYVNGVLPHLHPPDHVTMFYEVKADLTRKDLDILANAHVKLVQPGIEALATSTLKLMRKGSSAFSNLVFLKNCRDVGIVPAWNLLVGFPGETDKVFQKYVDDMPLFVHLQPPSGVYPVRFDRYSPYFDKAKDYGLDLHANDWYGYVYPFSPAVLDQIAYYFMNHDFEAPYLRAVVKHMNAMQQRIDAWRALWHPSNPVPPELTLRKDAGTATITDSRFATPRRYAIDSERFAFLQFLNAPKRRHEIDQRFETAAAGLLRWGAEQNLLFEEDGRFLSLAIDLAVVEAERHADSPAGEVVTV